MRLKERRARSEWVWREWGRQGLGQEGTVVAWRGVWIWGANVREGSEWRKGGPRAAVGLEKEEEGADGEHAGGCSLPSRTPWV